jgi:hypothetical protein
MYGQYNGKQSLEEILQLRKDNTESIMQIGEQSAEGMPSMRENSQLRQIGDRAHLILGNGLQFPN